MRHLIWPMSRIELAARLAALFCMLLFLATLWGHFQIHDKLRVNNIVRTVRSMDALESYARREEAHAPWETLTPRQKMNAWYAAINDRLIHGDSDHGFFSNWVMWSLGFLNDNVGLARTPDVLLRTQASGLCSEASYLMVAAAKREGLPARHVGLNGHVVAEIEIDGTWHLYDPDMDVRSGMSRDGESFGDFNIDTLAADSVLAHKAYPAKYAAMIASTDDNKTGAPYAQFNVGAQRLMQLEQLAEWLKFAIPVIGFLVAAGIVRWAKKRTTPDSKGQDNG